MKTCAICHTENAPDVRTCSGCGEGTWPGEASETPTVRRPLHASPDLEEQAGVRRPFPKPEDSPARRAVRDIQSRRSPRDPS